jgi:hypothetical protein
MAMGRIAIAPSATSDHVLAFGLFIGRASIG